jgi:hypothetical protein
VVSSEGQAHLVTIFEELTEMVIYTLVAAKTGSLLADPGLVSE